MNANHSNNAHIETTGLLRGWISRLRAWGTSRRAAGKCADMMDGIASNMAAHEEPALMIMASSYAPVADSDYVMDRTVGAKIGSAAIRTAMQRSLDTGMGVIHIHMHGGKGMTGFSPTDRKTMNVLVPSFFNVSPSVPHGALVFNRDSIAGVVWRDKQSPISISRVSVIGYPCSFDGGINHV